MARAERFRFSHTRQIESADRYVSAAVQAGVIMRSAGSGNGRYLEVEGARALNFGSCSYMALETRPELREAAHAAIDHYGTQFSFSRAYMQCPLYLELEALLEQMTGRPVVVAASTSLAHMAALPTLIRDTDHIVIDQFAHASLHSAVKLVPSVPLEILRHNRIDQLDALLTRLRDHPGNIWYLADGVYSMLGDLTPFDELKQLLARHPKLRLYIDDAHATSCFGQHGRGLALDHFGDDERVVVALSLNKAFAAAGGIVALPTREAAGLIRRCGGPMLFSGPIQPPMLGAAVASARLHLSAEFPGLQAQLHERIDVCDESLSRRTLNLTTGARTPIFQAECDSPRVVFTVADLMLERGFLCCICVFPAVPMNRPGIRFTLSRHNELPDIEPFVSALEECLELGQRQALAV
ncbi:MAG TPA: aminotransferase class I/II-fold pyridoxal phosphate-dependent enzyme [Polyangiales bacterium]|nr:aminotransferase class I/II-fold pyridoxal phosphate-dependent enzyme [Polyangiales bacterium]